MKISLQSTVLDIIMLLFVPSVRIIKDSSEISVYQRNKRRKNYGMLCLKPSGWWTRSTGITIEQQQQTVGCQLWGLKAHKLLAVTIITY